MKHTKFRQTVLTACLVAGAVFGSISAQAQVLFPAANSSISPVNDAFYTAPAGLASLAPGQLIRYREFTAKEYTKGEVVKAYHVMFRSTGQKGQATAVVTTILVPSAPATGKLFSYNSFYDSLTPTCTPSFLSTKGTLFEGDYVKAPLLKGHVVVMTDYEGLDNQWIAGKNTAYGVLDGIRAAINFQPARLAANAAVAMMGFSGGGHASGWAAEMAPSYAPELNIVGIAMGGVPVNVANVARKVDGGLFSSVYLAAVVGLSRAYPELDPAQYATPEGLKAIDDIGGRCLLGLAEGQPDMLVKYGFKKSSAYLKNSAGFLDLPEIKVIIDENNLGQRTPTAPLFVYQGLLDEIMPTADVDKLVKNYCDAGVKVQYKKIVSDHLLMAINPSVMRNFVLDRLDGKPFTIKTCN